MHPSWKPIVERAYGALDPQYRDFLESSTEYFPEKALMFNAFTLPLEKTKYILFGQDPYPRRESAIGYAFIDGKVDKLFSEKGLSKEVNRATSLRNFMKMCLLLEGKLTNDLGQSAIALADKSDLIETVGELKDNFLREGVLLLNMGLVFTEKSKSRYHVKMWRPFMQSLLTQLQKREIELILFGNISKEIERFDNALTLHRMEHPYNISFIHNKTAHKLFKPMALLKKF